MCEVMERLNSHCIVDYPDFLALWKNAGADIPILKQTQAEHANLQ
jgi:hypothetical protein